MNHFSNDYQFAGFSDRFIALLIDAFLIIIGFAVIAVIVGSPYKNIQTAIHFGIGIVYYWYFWTQCDGQSPGKLAMKIRVVKADGSPISNYDMMIRYLGYTISTFLFFLGYLWMFWDKNNQTWHDKMANTYVIIDVRPTDTVYV